MGRNAANDGARDTRDSLALWIAQRHGSAADYRRVLNERENDLLALSEASGPRSVAHTTALRQTHDAQMQYNQIQTSVRRPLNKTTVRTAFFVAFVLALALLEAPVNKYLFDVALQGSSAVSYSVSIAVAFFLLTIAHLAGKSLRQVWSDHRKKVIWSNLLVFTGCIGVIATVICILTVGRASTSAESSINSFNDIFSAVGAKTAASASGARSAIPSATSPRSSLPR